MIRIRNLLSIKFFELYLYISLRNVSPQTLNSEVPFDPSGSPAFLQSNFARFAFSQLLCFPIFHRSFAATGWPEKHSFPFETTSNAWEVFCSYFLYSILLTVFNLERICQIALNQWPFSVCLSIQCISGIQPSKAFSFSRKLFSKEALHQFHSIHFPALCDEKDTF